VAAPFHFEHSVAFAAENATTILRAIPALPGIFALHGSNAEAQPYLTRAADLRRRITRILAPPDSQSKRLNLRDRVARIDYTVTGSEFESTLTLYHASASVFGFDEARRRLKLRTPFFLRFTADNAYPRVYSTNRLSKRALANFYGPFSSRAAADRYCDAVLDLFKLRRCYEDLAPYPEHPGCVYQEMNKCLAPCNQACTPAGAAAYAAEADAVHAFFQSHGESMLAPLIAQRDHASADLDFERAADLHAQVQKVKAAQSLADELVAPIPNLRALILQKAAPPLENAAPPLNDVVIPPPQEAVILSGANGVPAQLAGWGWKNPRISPEAPQQPATSPESQAAPPPDPCSLAPVPAAALFLLHSGCLTGPARLSTLGIRAVKEQTSVGSSLFAQPLMLQAVPLEESAQPAEVTPSESPELRAGTAIAALEAQASAPTDIATLSDHLSLLRRWYYRPEKQRAGEVFLPNANREWPIRRILNAAARAALGDPKPMAEAHRELVQRNPADETQQPTRTRTLHAGRPDVERTVPILATGPGQPTVKSRRKRTKS
jgi:hypothetical protein